MGPQLVPNPFPTSRCRLRDQVVAQHGGPDGRDLMTSKLQLSDVVVDLARQQAHPTTSMESFLTIVAEP